MALLRCDLCMQDKPVSSYPNLKAAQICGPCMTGQRDQKTELAMQAKAQQIAAQFVDIGPTELAAETGRVKQIVADIYKEFGGPSGYATHFHWVVMKLCERDPMPVGVAAVLLQVMKLHHTIEQTEEMVTAREMTDEQLKREQEIAVMKIAIEAMGDPNKRDVLTAVLARQGLAITIADPELTRMAVANQVLGVPDEVMSQIEQNFKVPGSL